MPCEVYHIVVGHCAHIGFGVHTLLGLEMRITTGLPRAARRHVAQSRMIGHTQCDTAVECGSNERERPTLATSHHGDIPAVPVWKGAKEVEQSGMKNVRFLRTNIDFIEWIFGPGEIDSIWVTFADPQLKSPRKRLTSPMFLNRYRKFLREGGTVNLKTDSRFLHEYTAAVVKDNKLEEICRGTDIYSQDNPAFPHELKTVQTFYEQYFLKMGMPITYLAFRLDGQQKNTELAEPQWDEKFWLEKEKEGRIPGRIR